MDSTDTIVQIWRCLNVGLAAVSLLLLILDVVHRRRLKVRARFYWEAVALFVLSLGWASAEAIHNPPTDWSPARTAVVTVAMVYFLISIIRVRRSTDLELELEGVES